MALSTVYPPRAASVSSAVAYVHSVTLIIGAFADLEFLTHSGARTRRHAIDIWTHPKSNALWRKDFLPRQVPDARVMTFGYNAAAAFGQSMAEVIDHEEPAERPDPQAGRAGGSSQPGPTVDKYKSDEVGRRKIDP